MQTFIPFPDYVETAKSLDIQRLRNQCCNESIVLSRGKWPNHPASKMWRGHEFQFAIYNVALAAEWRERAKAEGKPTASADKWFAYWVNKAMEHRHENTEPPAWLGDERVHSTHRSCLLAKNPEWYSQFDWAEQPTHQSEDGKWPYFWPKPQQP